MEDEKPLESSPAYEANHPEESLSTPGLATRKVSYQEYEALEQKLLEEQRRLEDRYWLDKNLHLFDELLRQQFDRTLPAFSEAILTYIAKLSSAVHAAFYLYNFENKQLEASAGYACTVETMARPVFQLGEGLVGQAAKSGEMFFLDNIETQLDSSIGRVNATTLLILPLVFDRAVYGVIELNALSAPSERILDLLQHLVRNTAVVLQSLSQREKTKKQLLQELESSSAFQSLVQSLQEKEQKIQALEAQLSTKSNTPDNEPSQAGEELSNPQRAQMETELDSLRLQLRQKEEEIAQIRQQTEAQSQHQEKEKADKVIENLERQLQQTQNQLDILRTELNLAEVEKEALHLQIERMQEANPPSDVEISTMEAKITELDQQIPALNERNQQLKADLERRSKELEMMRETIKWKDAEIERQDDALLEKKRAIQNLEKVINELQSENLGQVEEIVRQGKALKQREEELEQLKAEVQGLVSNEEIEALKNEIEQKTAAIAHAFQEIETLQTAFQASQEQIALLEGQLLSAKQAQESAQSISKNYEARFQSQSEQLESTLAKLRKKEDELLVSQYLLAQQENGGMASPLLQMPLQERLQQKEEEIARLHQELARQREALSEPLSEPALDPDLAQKVEAQAAEIAHFQQIIEQKNRELQLLQERLESRQHIFEDNDLGHLQEMLAEKEAELFRMQEGNLLQVEALRNLKEDLARRDQLIAELRAASEEVQKDDETLNQTLAELRQKEQEIVSQSEALTNLRTQLLEKEKKIEQLQREYASLATTPANPAPSEVNDKLSELENIQNTLLDKESEIKRQTEMIRTQKSEILEKHQQLEALRDNLHQKEQEIEKQQNVVKGQQEQLLTRQTELEQKEKELRALFNKINTAFAALEFDMEGNILSINNKYLMMLGRNVQELEGKPLEVLLPAEYMESTDYRVLWEGLKMGATQTFDNFMCLGNKNRAIPMSVTFIPIIGQDGRPYEVVLLVNHLVQETESPAESISPETPPAVPLPNLDEEVNQKLKAFDNYFIVMELDLEGNIIYANKQFSIFLGYDENEVLGKHHRNFLDITERNAENYLSILKKLPTGGYTSDVFKYQGKEGERVRLRSYFNPIFDAQKNITKTLVISQFVN